MNILDLKKLILTTKKEDKELSVAYSLVLGQVEKQTVGKIGVTKSEKELMLDGAKKELKEQKQSKEAGAPYSEKTIAVCEKIISELGVKQLSERETEYAIKDIIEMDGKNSVMKILKEKFGEKVNMQIASNILKTLSTL